MQAFVKNEIISKFIYLSFYCHVMAKHIILLLSFLSIMLLITTIINFSTVYSVNLNNSLNFSNTKNYSNQFGDEGNQSFANITQHHHQIFHHFFHHHFFNFCADCVS